MGSHHIQTPAGLDAAHQPGDRSVAWLAIDDAKTLRKSAETAALVWCRTLLFGPTSRSPNVSEIRSRSKIPISSKPAVKNFVPQIRKSKLRRSELEDPSRSKPITAGDKDQR
ncbi:hypothetical protein EVAR_24435_1 [Eumeta japonica]|uniref:Uncharacterized protein n=1 Tax=Eumeta variegata TaxID=151549 RepID=A0A4C1WYR9_EUMVA|nr:hypothetical protein EVAR_24435_1 [Eumeta japonica]